jgi:Lamin Tail Domain
MTFRKRSQSMLVALACGLMLASSGFASVLINELVYDDGSTDDREFVELYNSGANAVDISGWQLRSSDTTAPPGDNNGDVTIPANTTLNPGAFYVIGYAVVPNVNQTVSGASGFFENDQEISELLDVSGNVVDAVVYERNKGAVAQTTTRGGLWGNFTHGDVGTGSTTSSIGRWLNGVDSQNNGRDFGLRGATPGTSNTTAGINNTYTPPSVSASGTGTTVPGYAFSFVAPRVIEPTVVDTNNLNAIPNPPNGETKVHTMWDPSGGGDASSLETTMAGGGSFDLYAYLDTNDIPINTTTTGTQFRGSEITVFGIGGADPFTNLTDLTGDIQLGAASVSANGITGVAWIYEKAGLTGAGGVSEKLHLVDANDGGNSNATHASGLDWTILATIDLSASPSDWYRLAISVDAAGNGTAIFGTQSIPFMTAAGLNGAFSVGYRENLNLPSGSTGVPGYVRPPTWTLVPEPSSLVTIFAGIAMLAAARRK